MEVYLSVVLTRQAYIDRRDKSRRSRMAASESNVPRLVVVSPAEREGFVFDLSGEEMVIGHSDTADIFVEDPYLSRRHALLWVYADEVTLHDLNSTAGTFVNEERLTGPRVCVPATWCGSPIW